MGSKISGFVLAALAVFALCRGFAAAQESSDKKLKPLTLPYSSISGTRLPIWIAKEAKVFEKSGLDITQSAVKGKKPAEFLDVSI